MLLIYIYNIYNQYVLCFWKSPSCSFFFFFLFSIFFFFFVSWALISQKLSSSTMFYFLYVITGHYSAIYNCSFSFLDRYRESSIFTRMWVLNDEGKCGKTEFLSPLRTFNTDFSNIIYYGHIFLCYRYTPFICLHFTIVPLEKKCLLMTMFASPYRHICFSDRIFEATSFLISLISP